MRIGIIGTGIAGMTAAHLLQARHEVHVFEADDRPGGHANTVTVDLPGGPGRRRHRLPRVQRADLSPVHAVAGRPGGGDAPERDELQPHRPRAAASNGAARRCRPSSPSAATWPGPPSSPCWPTWSGSTGWPAPCSRGRTTGAGVGTLADLLADHRWSTGFLDWYLIPLGSAIWSADPETFTQIPAAHVRRVLQPPRSARPGRPAGLADGDRRVRPATWRPSSSRVRRRGRLHLRTAVAKVRRARTGGRAPDRERTRSPSTTWCVATHSDQALALAGRPHRPGSAACSAPCATSRTGPPSTPNVVAARQPPGLGVVELRAPDRADRPGDAHLLPEPPAGPAGRRCRCW